MVAAHLLVTPDSDDMDMEMEMEMEKIWRRCDSDRLSMDEVESRKRYHKYLS